MYMGVSESLFIALFYSILQFVCARKRMYHWRGFPMKVPKSNHQREHLLLHFHFNMSQQTNELTFVYYPERWLCYVCTYFLHFPLIFSGHSFYLIFYILHIHMSCILRMYYEAEL